MNTNCKSGAYRGYKTIRNYIIAITMHLYTTMPLLSMDKEYALRFLLQSCMHC